jgi:hypothetical protein
MYSSQPLYTSAEKFNDLFSEIVNQPEIQFEEIEILKSHIKDCISYHEGSQKFLPTVIYNEPIKCEASIKQLSKYLESNFTEQMLMNIVLDGIKDEEQNIFYSV